MKLPIITIFLLLICSLNTNAQNISGSWIGQMDMDPTKLRIVFNFHIDSSEREICTMDSPDQSVKGIPASLLLISSDSVSITMPAHGITYNGKLLDGQIKGVFSQMGMNFNLNLEPNIVEYKRPQNPTNPRPYLVEDVTFTNKEANVTLSGTITYPVNYKKEDKPPIVLMVNGSGGQNRDYEVFEHKFFLVISDYFAKKGIATLRYDDRSVGKSTGEYQASNTSEVAADAQEGISFLRERDQFSRVGILGHSEGANVAYMLGSKGLIDFIISMAGSGIQGDECLYTQAKKGAEISGQEYSLTKEQFRSIIYQQNNSWLDYFIDYNPILDIQDTNCPVLAINGDKDMQVISTLNIRSIETNLPYNDKSEFIIYPNLNHFFQECETGMPYEYLDIEQTIYPLVLNDMVNWVNKINK